MLESPLSIASAQNAYQPFHVVGQNVRGHFGADVLERFHLEVSGSHPGLYRTEWMLHGLASGFRSRRACTKATLIYRRTGNLRAVQLLVGHTKIESTVRYLGIEVDDALAMAEQVDV